MVEEIGAVLNHAEPESLQHLALFKDSISQILLCRGEEPSEYFSPEYSHYIVVHTPLDIEPSEQKNEWSRRFSSRCGVSIVERIGERERLRRRGRRGPYIRQGSYGGEGVEGLCDPPLHPH